MALNILVGRAGSGKSRRVLDAIRENRNLRHQILLVPEHTSHAAEVDLCHTCGDTASRDAEVLSFRTLAARVLSQTGGAADVTLDNGGKILTLRRCLQELAPDLKLFTRPSLRSAFLQQLMALFDEFYAYNVAPETLLHSVDGAQGAAGDKLRDIALLFAAYDAKLHGEGFDARSRMQKLCQALPQTDYLDGKDLYLDGFSFFNALEEQVLAYALHHCAHVTVTLLGDKHDRALFSNAQKQRERLVRMAQLAGQKCTIQYIPGNRKGALGHLEQHFFGADSVWDAPTEEVALYEAVTAYSEVEYVSSRIRALAMQGVRYRDIGVACRRMEDYGALIREIFRRDGIPAYVSRRSDVTDHPVITMLTSAVDAAVGGFAYDDMFRYLKTGLAGITAEECDLLENYVILWNIRGGLWLQEVPWAAHPAGYGSSMTEADEKTLAEIHAIRRKVSGPLRGLYEGLKTGETAREKAKTLYTFAEASRVPDTLRQRSELLLRQGEAQLAAEYRQLWDIFCDVLDQFVAILGDTAVSGQEFARLLRLVLTQYSVGTIPATLDQVKVSEITRNDRHTVRYLFLLGANDHVLPPTEQPRGILDDEDRRTLRNWEIRLSDDSFDELDNELQNIYACLVQPTEQLHVSYPVTDVSGSQLRPSFVVQRLQKLFPHAVLRREDGAFRMTLPATALAEAGKQPEGPAWAFFRGQAEYEDICRRMDDCRHMERGALSPQGVEALYGAAVPMSASRMDRIRSCHFAYFMEYGLRAKERTTADFDAPQRGTFIHYLLENVARVARERGGFAALDDDTLRQLAKQFSDEFTRTQIGDLTQKSARFRYLYARLQSAAYAIIESMAAELRQSDFQPVAFELGFGGKDGALPAIRVEQDDTTLFVTGKVDRVDAWESGGKLYLRVVDYKTGAKEFSFTDVRYGLGIQMLLYLFTLQKEGEPYFGKPVVPCGVLYHPARELILKMDRASSEEKIQKELRKKLRRSGLLLEDTEVLDAMEHGAPAQSCYLPVGMKKDGALTGTLASAEQLGKLGRHVDRVLQSIAAEIGRGNIDADPCVHNVSVSACTWCPYRAVCGFDEKYDRYRYLQRTEPEQFWDLLDREEGDHA